MSTGSGLSPGCVGHRQMSIPISEFIRCPWTNSRSPIRMPGLPCRVASGLFSRNSSISCCSSSRVSQWRHIHSGSSGICSCRTFLSASLQYLILKFFISLSSIQLVDSFPGLPWRYQDVCGLSRAFPWLLGIPGRIQMSILPLLVYCHSFCHSRMWYSLYELLDRAYRWKAFPYWWWEPWIEGSQA